MEKKVFLDTHFKSGGTDGVSLMMELLHQALEKHSRSLIASSDAIRPNDLNLPELSYQSPKIKDLREKILIPGRRGQELPKDVDTEIQTIKKIIKDKFKEYVLAHKVNHVIVRNLFSLPLNIAATLALWELINDTELQQADVRWVLIHHDFYFEPCREQNYQTPYLDILGYLGEMFPPANQPHILQFVINSLMQQTLLERFQVTSHVMPDMNDFATDNFQPERQAGELRQKLNIRDEDMMILMPTRVVPRKAVEFAIEFAASTQTDGSFRKLPQFRPESQVYLVIPQGEDLRDNQEYISELTKLAQRRRVKLLFAGEHVRADHSPQLGVQDKQQIPFLATYKEADLVIYPTVSEGFGNQLTEIVSAGCIPIMFEYPVFQADIKQYLPHFISLGSTYIELPGETKQLPPGIYQRAVTQAIDLLKNPAETRTQAQANLEQMSARFGMEPVAQRFLQLVEQMSG